METPKRESGAKRRFARAMGFAPSLGWEAVISPPGE